MFTGAHRCRFRNSRSLFGFHLQTKKNDTLLWASNSWRQLRKPHSFVSYVQLHPFKKTKVGSNMRLRIQEFEGVVRSSILGVHNVAETSWVSRHLFFGYKHAALNLTKHLETSICMIFWIASSQESPLKFSSFVELKAGIMCQSWILWNISKHRSSSVHFCFPD